MFHGDPLRLKQDFDSVNQIFNYPGLSFHHRRQGVKFGLNELSKHRGMSYLAKYFGICKKRLGWNTSSIEAGPTDPVLLNQGDPTAQLGSSNRRHVAAGTSSNDNNPSEIHRLDPML